MTAPTTARTKRPRIKASTWLAVAFVGVFAYFDWITHRELPLTLIMAGIVIALIVYRQPIITALNLGETFAAIPKRAKPVLAAIPGLAYFLIRGQGTSGAGGIVFTTLVGVVLVSALFGPTLDRSLGSYYRSRNRLLPRPVRMVLAIVLPVLVAFLVIHGSLGDLPALFGGTTHHPQSPVGRDGYFFLGTLLSAAVAWLLLREAPPAAAGAAGQLTARPASTWTPTHSVPAGGLTAWAQPSETAATMRIDGGVEVRIVSRSGDWVQVAAVSGWSGWVDGRLLDPVRGQR